MILWGFKVSQERPANILSRIVGGGVQMLPIPMECFSCESNLFSFLSIFQKQGKMLGGILSRILFSGVYSQTGVLRTAALLFLLFI